MRTDSSNDLVRYQILMQHSEFLHKLFWGRVQTLNLVQAGVLTSFFYLKEKWPGYSNLAFSILALGIILTIFLFVNAKHDWHDAAVNRTRLFALGDKLNIRWGSNHRISGHKLLYIAFILFICIDSYLIYWTLC